MKIQVSGFSQKQKQKTRIPRNAEPTSPRGNDWLELRAHPLEWGPVTSCPVVAPGSFGICSPFFNASVHSLCLGQKSSSYFSLTLQCWVGGGGEGGRPLHLPPKRAASLWDSAAFQTFCLLWGYSGSHPPVSQIQMPCDFVQDEVLPFLVHA